jgi:hypothetical protein
MGATASLPSNIVFFKGFSRRVVLLACPAVFSNVARMKPFDFAQDKLRGIRERGMFGSPDCIWATKAARGMSIPPFRRGLKPPSTVAPSRSEV